LVSFFFRGAQTRLVYPSAVEQVVTLSSAEPVSFLGAGGYFEAKKKKLVF
jgi:hypothetical protein